MPTFDITSEFNTQEITNAVDQAYREIVNRYDFRDTGTNIEFNEQTITLKSSTEERLKAAEQVLKEKFVKRNVSIKFLSGACSVKNLMLRLRFIKSTTIDIIFVSTLVYSSFYIPLQNQILFCSYSSL